MDCGSEKSDRDGILPEWNIVIFLYGGWADRIVWKFRVPTGV